MVIGRFTKLTDITRLQYIIMFEQIHKHLKTPKHKHRLQSMPICCDIDLSVICRKCGYFVTSLSTASNYINIDIPHYQFGNHFLVIEQISSTKVRVDHRNQFLNSEDPFMMMILKKVYCSFCRSNCLGIYFETVNLLGNQWLLQSIAINMEAVSLQDVRLPFMDNTISQLYSLLNSIENANRGRKHNQRPIAKKKKLENNKMRNILYEKSLEQFIKTYTYKGFQQNRLKNQVASRILDSLAFFDRRNQRLEKEFQLLLTQAEALKKKIVTKYSTIQSFKDLVSKRQNDRFKQRN